MAATESGETKKITAGGTSASADFGDLVKGVYVKVSADTYIAFDRAATTDDFLVESADGAIFLKVPCTQVHAITSGGAATVYLIGVR